MARVPGRLCQGAYVLCIQHRNLVFADETCLLQNKLLRCTHGSVVYVAYGLRIVNVLQTWVFKRLWTTSTRNLVFGFAECKRSDARSSGEVGRMHQAALYQMGHTPCIKLYLKDIYNLRTQRYALVTKLFTRITYDSIISSPDS